MTSMCAIDMTNTIDNATMGAGIDALLLAARFLDENEGMLQEQRVQPPPLPPPQPPPPPAPLAMPIPATALLRPLVLPKPTLVHHVPLQAVTIQATTTAMAASQKASPPPPPPPAANRLTVMNSFDIINPPVLDHGSGEVKRKPPPMAFRTGTREVHNKLEKNRRAQLKECFDQLYAQLPDSKENKKTSNLSILESAKRCIGALEGEQRHHELQMEMLAKEKIALQTRVTNLKRDIYALYNVEVTLAGDEEARTPRKQPRVANGIAGGKPLEPARTLATSAAAAAVLVKPAIAAIACASNVLRLPKSISGALPVMAAATPTPASAPPANGVKPELASAVLPFSIPVTPSSLQVVQKIMMTSAAPTHFITSTQPPTLVNALVVVSTPSRSS